MAEQRMSPRNEDQNNETMDEAGDIGSFYNQGMIGIGRNTAIIKNRRAHMRQATQGMIKTNSGEKGGDSDFLFKHGPAEGKGRVVNSSKYAGSAMMQNARQPHDYNEVSLAFNNRTVTRANEVPHGRDLAHNRSASVTINPIEQLIQPASWPN